MSKLVVTVSWLTQKTCSGFIKAEDSNAPVRSCGHFHRSSKAARACAERLLSEIREAHSDV